MLSPKYKLREEPTKLHSVVGPVDPAKTIWAQVPGKKLPRGAQPERGPGEHLHEGDPDTQHDSQQEDRSRSVSSKTRRIICTFSNSVKFRSTCQYKLDIDYLYSLLCCSAYAVATALQLLNNHFVLLHNIFRMVGPGQPRTASYIRVALAPCFSGTSTSLV